MPRPGLTRRGLLGAGAGAAVGYGASRLVDGSDEASDGGSGTGRVPFHGKYQAGIVTPAQDRLHFAAFDLVTDDRTALRDLLTTWTAAAARLTDGKPVASEVDSPLAPPADTGEAIGLASSRLTITFGFGPKLVPGLKPLPALPGDQLDPDRSGGDLCVQACADDPQVAFHAVRNLARLARGTAVMRWSQLGFGRTSTTSRTQSTPRNLMGFKDGTNNLRAEDTAQLDQHVWKPNNGTYMVTRRIRMLIEGWDRASLQDQEQTIGRAKASGAPLNGTREDDPIVLADEPPRSHVALAHAHADAGVKILRRGYSFTDGMDNTLGELDAGLFFISFQRDPQQFVSLQTTLGRHDSLNEYIKHVGSAVFYVPPGLRPGGSVGDHLVT